MCNGWTRREGLAGRYIGARQEKGSEIGLGKPGRTSRNMEEEMAGRRLDTGDRWNSSLEEWRNAGQP